MMEMMVSGSRTGIKYEEVTRLLAVWISKLFEENPHERQLVIHHGGAEGVDDHVETFVNTTRRSMLGYGMDVSTKVHKPDYRQGKVATHIRNDEMLSENLDFVLCFIYNNSPGTSSVLKKARSKNIRNDVYIK